MKWRRPFGAGRARLRAIEGAIGAVLIVSGCTIGTIPLRTSIEGLSLYWQKLLSFTGDSSDANAEYGLSVSVHSDWAAVGCPSEPSTSGRGAVYLYEYANGEWSFSKKIAGTVDNGYFGRSVALSDAYLLVGAPGENSNQGAAYVFARTSAGWSSSSKKLIPTEVVAGDQFGYSVAIDGTWAVVGAPFHDITASASEGAAYVYARDEGGAGEWGTPNLGQQLYGGASRQADEGFGKSVGISGSYIVVGSPQGYGDATSLAGYLSVFELVSTTWGSAGAPTSRWAESGEKALGISVSISNEYLVAGASGTNAAFVYERSGTDWAGRRLSDPNGISTDQFGSSVAIDGTHLLVGAKFSKADAPNGGRVFPFEYDGETWRSESSFGKGPSTMNQVFGSSLSIDGDAAIVAGYGYDAVVGSVTFFQRAR